MSEFFKGVGAFLIVILGIIAFVVLVPAAIGWIFVLMGMLLEHVDFLYPPRHLMPAWL